MKIHIGCQKEEFLYSLHRKSNHAIKTVLACSYTHVYRNNCILPILNTKEKSDSVNCETNSNLQSKQILNTYILSNLYLTYWEDSEYPDAVGGCGGCGWGWCCGPPLGLKVEVPLLGGNPRPPLLPLLNHISKVTLK